MVETVFTCESLCHIYDKSLSNKVKHLSLLNRNHVYSMRSLFEDDTLEVQGAELLDLLYPGLLASDNLESTSVTKGKELLPLLTLFQHKDWWRSRNLCMKLQ